MPHKKSKKHAKSRKNPSKRNKNYPKSYKLPIFGLNLKNLDRTVANIEREAGKAYKELKHTLPKNWENNLRHLAPKDVIRYAMKKRKGIEKDVKRLSDEIVHTLQDAHFLSQKDRLVREAKKNLNQIVRKVEKSPVGKKGTQVLGLLQIPTRNDVHKLYRRVGKLEKRLNQISKRA